MGSRKSVVRSGPRRYRITSAAPTCTGFSTGSPTRGTQAMRTSTDGLFPTPADSTRRRVLGLLAQRGPPAVRPLADSTRRRILDLLAERGPLSVGQLAAQFPDLVPSGISKHLMSLRAAGLVSAARQGRKQVYRLEPDALIADLTPWIAKYEQYWSAALERLRDLAQDRGDKRGRASRKAVRRPRLK